jgi:hypothetical protein
MKIAIVIALLEDYKWVFALLLILLVDAGDNINLLQVIIRAIDTWSNVT